MALIEESSTQDAWGNLKDLLEVCPDCQEISKLGRNLYASHLYLAHLRNQSASLIS